MMIKNHFFKTHKTYKEQLLFGRYLPLEKIEESIKKLSIFFEVQIVGYSVENNPIHSVRFGSGKKHLFLWSQMHGNETTSTKALFDVFNFFDKHQNHDILKKCTIHVIPVLNPDGAIRYTRLNANEIDLNRDAIKLSQPESIVLRNVFDTIKPDICFNLHGQRTIFSAGNAKHSATMSFLAPAADKNLSITNSRAKSMELISILANRLAEIIPNQIGLYDDTYNGNCVGDTFQRLEVPTVLYEAGHFKDDYQREEVRKLYFTALLEAFSYLSNNDLNGNNSTDYANLPLNQKLFYDCIIRSAKTTKEAEPVDLGFQFDEVLEKNQIIFRSKLIEIGNLENKFGHLELDAKSKLVVGVHKETLLKNSLNDFVYINDELFALKSWKK